MSIRWSIGIGTSSVASVGGRRVSDWSRLSGDDRDSGLATCGRFSLAHERAPERAIVAYDWAGQRPSAEALSRVRADRRLDTETKDPSRSEGQQPRTSSSA
ncbi:hypothetical protein GCM10027563_22190 [Parasphingorhabdus pacifica]